MRLHIIHRVFFSFPAALSCGLCPLSSSFVSPLFQMSPMPVSLFSGKHSLTIWNNPCPVPVSIHAQKSSCLPHRVTGKRTVLRYREELPCRAATVCQIQASDKSNSGKRPTLRPAKEGKHCPQESASTDT